MQICRNAEGREEQNIPSKESIGQGQGILLRLQLCPKVGGYAWCISWYCISRIFCQKHRLIIDFAYCSHRATPTHEARNLWRFWILRTFSLILPSKPFRPFRAMQPSGYRRVIHVSIRARAHFNFIWICLTLMLTFQGTVQQAASFLWFSSVNRMGWNSVKYFWNLSLQKVKWTCLCIL